jgi:hypothetical protein
MNTKNTIKYIHETIGEIWIDKNCAVIEQMKEDKNKADRMIQTLFFNCYGRYTLEKQAPV